MFLTGDVGSNCHYQSCQGPWVHFKKLRITRIIWEVDGCALVMTDVHNWVVVFLYISVSLSNINRVHLILQMKILNADDKWFEQDSGTRDPAFSIPILSSLHYTGQNHRMKIQFESRFLVISKIQRKPQLSITYSGTYCNVLCHHFLPFLCLIWIIN